MDLKTLKNVEIFRVGIWKDFDYSTKHLDEMVINFEKFRDGWFRPAIKPGHGEMPGQEAAGYLDNVRRIDNVLMADFVDLPKDIYDAIKQRKYDRVSIEIVPKLEREGRVYRNVVWSLALLGVEVPEVSGLKPLRATLSSETEIVSLQTNLVILSVDDLPDVAFAAIETIDGDDGEDVRRYYFPHHNKSVTDPNDNDSVDFRCLMDAWIGLDRVEIPDDLRREAKSHIEQHAISLGIIPAKEKKKMTDKIDKKATPLDADIGEKFIKMQTQLDDANSKIKVLSTDLKASTDYAHGLEKKSRAERIGRKVEELQIPAMRKFAKVFYQWATDSSETPIKFSVDDKEVDLNPEAVVDEFVATMNKSADTLLTQHSKGTAIKRKDQPLKDNPGEEVDRRVKEFMAEKPDTDYNTALRSVLDKDPELKKQYASS